MFDWKFVKNSVELKTENSLLRSKIDLDEFQSIIILEHLIEVSLLQDWLYYLPWQGIH